MNAIDALEHELVSAARRRRPGRVRLPRRTGLLAAALVALLVAIPAFATGLVSFPQAHNTPHALGHGYVVAEGTSSVGEHWSFQLTRGVQFRDGTRSTSGWALLTGNAHDRQNVHGIAAGGGPGPKPDPRVGNVVGFMKPISSRDPRAMFLADVPRSVALVRLTFHHGPPLAVRPLRVDQERARATGIPYPYSFVALAYDPRDMPRTVTYEDAQGHDVTPSRGMTFPHGRAAGPDHARVLQSPAL